MNGSVRSQDPRVATDLELLAGLIGVRESRRRYRGSLHPFFADAAAGDPPPRCSIARELVRRWLNEQLQARPVFASPATVEEFLKLHFASREYESFVVLHLDAQNRLIAAEEMFRGTLTQTAVYPREVVKCALSRNAAAVVLAHNHPSGVPEPSRADEALTQTLRAALALVDVRILDHIIVAGPHALSLAARGLL